MTSDGLRDGRKDIKRGYRELAGDGTHTVAPILSSAVAPIDYVLQPWGQERGGKRE